MTHELHAWLTGEHIAVFSEDSRGNVALHYDSPQSPSLSLSLPNEGTWSRLAPARWLDNLLPEHPRAREHIALTHNATGTSTLELLHHAGADLAGAVTLLPPGQEPGDRQDFTTRIDDNQIRAAIAAIRAGHMSPMPVAGARMSLAGAQGKFSLTRIDDTWWTPTAALPSTHIFKPANHRHPQLDELELASLRLAATVGIPAADAALWHGAFVTQRFDRTTTSAGPQRRHMEDFAQALGLPVSEKYHVKPDDVLRILGTHSTLDQQHAFIQQLAFNVHLGNADAHAKNYSIFLDDRTLTPIYDAVPTSAFPSYDQRLAMKIGGARYAAEVQPSHWAKLARNTGLDPDTVLDLVHGTVDAMRQHCPSGPLQEAIAQATSGMTRGTSNTTP